MRQQALSAWLSPAFVGACFLLAPALARAEISAAALARALSNANLSSPLGGAALTLPPSWLIESTEPLQAPATRLTDSLFLVRREPSSVERLLKEHPKARGYWTPPLRPLLDRADGWVSSSAFRNETGLSGEGVIVGIVDTGFDVQHADLRNADGSSRVGWMIDFSRGPARRHPALEDEYGCTGQDFTCRILSSEDIDELLTNSVTGDEPRDRRGHGTHVASLAAGNGLSHSPPLYVGVAPQATLAVAQVSGPNGDIEQANVLLGTRFIFERAREAGAPAVVNISLGTDFGAHDGSSSIERALADFVNDREPGRALVVAAGNSAVQLVGTRGEYPEPLGVHSEVHVPAGTKVRVPVLTLSRDALTTGSLFLWLTSQPGDTLRLGVGEGSADHWVEPGQSLAYAVDDGSDEYLVTLVNGATGAAADLGVGSRSAALVISGSWRQGRSFELHLEGQGSALMWVEGTGSMTPGLGGGVFLPRSSKEGTIMIPASHPELIAVGATLNRRTWPTLAKVGSEATPQVALDVPLDSVAYFSSAGPNSMGLLKPDLVAPGVNVIGAMSRNADPRSSASSLFSGAACGDAACFVVDEAHAVATGSSMAAPIVTGAAALLLQRDPNLTCRKVRVLLQAGSRRARGAAEAQQVGAGALDLLGSLRAQDMNEGSASGGQPSPSQSRLALASSFVRPDPKWPLRGLLLLRDADDRVADVERGRLRFDASRASSVSLQRRGPGLFEFRVSALPDSGGYRQRLRVSVDHQVLLERSVPIAVDRPVAHAGFSARGGCSISRTSTGLWLLVPVGLGLSSIIRRRARRRASVQRP